MVYELQNHRLLKNQQIKQSAVVVNQNVYIWGIEPGMVCCIFNTLQAS